MIAWLYVPIAAGALFVSRLKKWKVYEEIKRTPPSRVGVKPGLTA